MEHKAPYLLFSEADGNLLIRILIALILGLVISKPANKILGERSRLQFVTRGIITSILTLILTLHLELTGAVSAPYLAITIARHWASIKWQSKKAHFAFLEVVLMALAAVLAWGLFSPGFDQLRQAICKAVFDYKFSLFILGYLAMLWPASSVVKFCLQGIAATTLASSPSDPAGPDAERGGRMIGMFERLIIITLVFLSEYAAIGFLITGKSIIRFAQTNEKIRSEYVLLGTMVSYAIAILTGALINWLLKLG